jgi:Peptidase propeptide and YPEB domain
VDRNPLTFGCNSAGRSGGRRPPHHRGRSRAIDKGIATIKEIELDDGVWEVEGRDRSGHKIEMEARSGEIVKMRRKD